MREIDSLRLEFKKVEMEITTLEVRIKGYRESLDVILVKMYS